MILLMLAAMWGAGAYVLFNMLCGARRPRRRRRKVVVTYS